jgi:hypothetical protein
MISTLFFLACSQTQEQEIKTVNNELLENNQIEENECDVVEVKDQNQETNDFLVCYEEEDSTTYSQDQDQEVQ